MTYAIYRDAKTLGMEFRDTRTQSTASFYRKKEREVSRGERARGFLERANVSRATVVATIERIPGDINERGEITATEAAN